MTELTWSDGEVGRTVVFDQGLRERAPKELADRGWSEYELFTTARALADAPAELADRAGQVRLVDPGSVPDIAAEHLDELEAKSLVALGGGRVIDVAKAIAAVRGGRVAAIPTTLSGAEMTGIHRLPAGHEGYGGVRPELVLADPEAMTSLAEPQLRATAMNALAHAGDSMVTPLADGISHALSLGAAELISSSLDADPADRSRSDLARGGILGGWAVDRAGLAIHHVLSQTTVRVCGTPHAETNAVLLPQTMEELRRRDPRRIDAFALALGTSPEGLVDRLRELGGQPSGLAELGASPGVVDEVVEAAMARPELQHMTPGEVSAGDLRRVLEAAW